MDTLSRNFFCLLLTIQTNLVSAPILSQSLTSVQQAGTMELGHAHSLVGATTYKNHRSGNANRGRAAARAATTIASGHATRASSNSVQYLDGITSSCTVAGITHAISLLPATGGIVDGRDCQGAQSFATNLTLASTTKPITLLLGDATWTAASGVTITQGGIGNKIIGAGRDRTKIVCANATADCVNEAPTNGELSHLTVDGSSTGIGAPLHIIAAESSAFYDLFITNAGANAAADIFLDPGSNSCERLRFDEIYTMGGPVGWYNKSTVNQHSCALLTIGHMELNGATVGPGYRSQGFDASTCNNGVTIQLLRTNGNAGDGADWIQECDQSITKWESEGNTGTVGNIDVKSQAIFITDLDASLNVGGNSLIVSGSTPICWSGLTLNFQCKSALNLYGSASGFVVVAPVAVAGGTVTFPNGTSATAIPASLVTTAAASDNLVVTGMTPSGHCGMSPRNANAAADSTSTFISAYNTNQITVAHPASANRNWDFVCTPN